MALFIFYKNQMLRSCVFLYSCCTFGQSHFDAEQAAKKHIASSKITN